MTNEEIFRGRYLDSFAKGRPLRPESVREYRFSLHDVDHVFKAGHTVMVEIQSTWFPLYDRNPQKFVPNIFEAKAGDYQKATQRIYRTSQYPSHIEMSAIVGAIGSTTPYPVAAFGPAAVRISAKRESKAAIPPHAFTAKYATAITILMGLP